MHDSTHDPMHDPRLGRPYRESVWFDLVVAALILLATCLLGATTLR